ncbi:hypothetical protein CORC01_14230 [Colletotrichum orchidophilum]|uniref:Uncharacterized protein n=1 Tax=Colletotrichum orchidophilum TaxID=1209926 RepID=A0A1G4AMS3_9PEZI|nr:uncharacterized protein CORC01_14230 [Colletotrichum orchidophilum]OHE90464.1 hypothetical protein CORC01_14230 [Colletotrichum orchidophilum]
MRLAGSLACLAEETKTEGTWMDVKPQDLTKEVRLQLVGHGGSNVKLGIGRKIQAQSQGGVARPLLFPILLRPLRGTMCLDPNCEAQTALHYMWNVQQYLSGAQKELVFIYNERFRIDEEHRDIFRLPIGLPAHDVSGEWRSRYYRALSLVTRMHHLDQRERVLREGCQRAHQALLIQLARFGGIEEISAIATESQMGPQGQPRKRRRTSDA